MAETNQAEAPATAASEKEPASLAELKAAFGGRPAFVLEQFEAEATLEEASAAYLQLELKEAKAANVKLSAKVEELSKRPTGAPPKASGVDPELLTSEGTVDTGGGFLERARALAEEKGITKRAAMSQIAKDDPDVFDAYKEHCWTQKRRVKRERSS